MRRPWVYVILVLLMLPLLACNCSMLEGLSELLPETGPPSGEATPVVTPPTAPAATSAPLPRPTFPAITLDELDVPLMITNPTALPRQGEPVTSGLPIPRQLGLTDLTNLRLFGPDGTAVPAQFTPLARWGGAPDDSTPAVRWLLLDFQADVPAGGTVTYLLQGTGGAAPPFPTLNITDAADAITIDTGVAVFSVSKTNGGLTAPGVSAPIHGRIRDLGGGEHVSSGPVEVSVELNGPMRASVKVKGTHGAGLDYTNRFWFYAGQSAVRLYHTTENNTLCPVAEDGQLLCYHIGSGGDVTFTDLSLIVPSALDGGLTYQAGGAGTPASGTLHDALLLYQDSSGTDHWDKYPTLTDWEGNPLDTRPRMQSYVSFRGYRTTLGGATADSGDQAAGWLSLSGSDGAWEVAVRDFWQNFPKALRATPDGTLEIGLFPQEFGPGDYAFILRAGEHKTHEILLLPMPAETGMRAETFSSPLFAQAPPEWYVGSGAFGSTALRDFESWPDHEQYLDRQLAYSGEQVEMGDYFSSLLDAIEGSDFYGIFDYGDWPLDYEGYEVAPLNPKYNNDYGVWLQWLRGGDPRWFGLAEAFDRHVADVDILHTLHSPRNWADGTAFGHSEHDEDGFTNPHRNANSSHPDTIYGMAGMLLTYYVTGYEKAYESAMELADSIEYRVHNDWLLSDYFPDSNGEGYGLGGIDGMYADNCRPTANCLFMLTEAYRATADSRYLGAADAIVDWARAAKQPYINGPTGDSEWDSYIKPQMLNMYLLSLGRYLDMREEFGLSDTYDAGGSLLGYADWLGTYAWIDLEPIDTGDRGTYPYEWYFDNRQGDPSDEWSLGNNMPVITNWLLLGADAMAYAYRYSGNPEYLELATRLFRTGSRDPWYEEDDNTYAESKETANSVAFGHVFLYEWANRP